MVRKLMIRVAGSVLGTAAICACAGVSLRPVVPERLEVGAEQPLALLAHAAGVQVYACVPGAVAATFEWKLKAPDAELFDEAGHRIGRHYAGPTWEAADGSKVVGEVRARVDAPDAETIPWLLLAATSNSGAGVFAPVRSIQRIGTQGGSAPHETPCDETQLGSERRVPYTATYVFYGPAA